LGLNGFVVVVAVLDAYICPSTFLIMLTSMAQIQSVQVKYTGRTT